MYLRCDSRGACSPTQECRVDASRQTPSLNGVFVMLLLQPAVAGWLDKHAAHKKASKCLDGSGLVLGRASVGRSVKTLYHSSLEPCPLTPFVTILSNGLTFEGLGSSLASQVSVVSTNSQTSSRLHDQLFRRESATLAPILALLLSSHLLGPGHVLEYHIILRPHKVS